MGTEARKPAVSRHGEAAERVPGELRESLVRDQARIARFFGRDETRSAGALVDAVDFPDFVRDLIGSVFTSVLQASVEQVRAYAELVANVARTVDQFSHDHITPDQGREWLAATYPDLAIVNGRLRVREGASVQLALARLNRLPLEGAPLSAVEGDSEERLAAAAARELEAERRRKVTETLLLGLNRIVAATGKTRGRASDVRSGGKLK